MVFLLFPGHHHGEVGLKLFEKNYDWDNVDVALTLEHPSLWAQRNMGILTYFAV